MTLGSKLLVDIKQPLNTKLGIQGTWRNITWKALSMKITSSVKAALVHIVKEEQILAELFEICPCRKTINQTLAFKTTSYHHLCFVRAIRDG
jgi:hypothetical protein